MRQAGRSLPEYRAARRAQVHAGRVHHARPDHRDHPAAAAPVPGGRGDPVQRHRGAAARGGRRTSTSSPASGPVVGAADPRARPTWPGCARWSRAMCRTWPTAVSALVGRAGRHAADRVRRRPVHAGLLSGRRRAVEEPRADQGADVRRPAAVACAARAADRHHHRVPAGPGAPRAPPPSSCSTPGSARSARRTTGGGAAAQQADLRGTGRNGRAADPLRRRHRRTAGADGRGGRGRGRGGLAGAAGRGGAPGRDPARRCRATSTRPCCWRPGRWSSGGPGRCWPAAAPPRGTCSTSATGCCRETDPDMLARLADLVHEESAGQR